MKSAPINLWLLVSLTIAAMVVAVMLLTQAVPRDAAFMAGILVLAALLWMTEAVPPFGTSLLVIGLQILLLANPGGWPGLGFEDQQSPTSPTYLQVLAAAADPVLVLFFGGLLLARAATKEKMDQALAGLVLHPLRNRPMFLLLAVMLRIAMSIALTASISMALPVSTPPNAIAYAHEVTTKREMAQVGILVGFFGLVLVIALANRCAPAAHAG